MEKDPLDELFLAFPCFQVEALEAYLLPMPICYIDLTDLCDLIA